MQDTIAKEQKKFGTRMKDKRAEMGLSQKELAEKIGVTDAQIGHIERGLFWPSMPVYIKICRELAIEGVK